GMRRDRLRLDSARTGRYRAFHSRSGQSRSAVRAARELDRRPATRPRETRRARDGSGVPDPGEPGDARDLGGELPRRRAGFAFDPLRHLRRVGVADVSRVAAAVRRRPSPARILEIARRSRDRSLLARERLAGGGSATPGALGFRTLGPMPAESEPRTGLGSVTHLVGDVERVASRVWILKEGRLLADEPAHSGSAATSSPR